MNLAVAQPAEPNAVRFELRSVVGAAKATLGVVLPRNEMMEAQRLWAPAELTVVRLRTANPCCPTPIIQLFFCKFEIALRSSITLPTIVARNFRWRPPDGVPPWCAIG